MKSVYSICTALILVSGALSAFSQTGNVGIGTIHPQYKLTVQTPGGNWGFMHTDSSVYIGSYIYSGSAAGFGTRSNHPLYLFANNVDNPPAIAIDKGGTFVGIDNNNPIYNLDVHSLGDAQMSLTNQNGNTAILSRYTNRLEIQPNDNLEVSVGGIDRRNLFIPLSGYVGINTSTPATQLQVLTADGTYGVTHTNGSITVGTYVGNGAGWLGTQSNHPLNFFTNNGGAAITLATSGNVGIGASGPANKLQIGDVSSSGYNGNDIAFGNGSQASAIAQTAAIAQWYSNTNIALMPMGNGHGRVGINTTHPSAPLEVDDYVSFGTAPYAYFTDGISTNSNPGGSFQSADGVISPQVSIAASSNVAALEFDAYSDARIKNIENVSNSSKDLETLKNIQITDYTLRDKVKNGNKQFKKVIAQQVESVYPQVVNKKVNFIPNVYQLTNKIEKTSGGYLLTFKNKHLIDTGAKKLQLISKNGEKQVHDIVAIPADNQVLIHSQNITDDQVFVYGEQVNDFRTVDYDGLTTLNISATQELSKLITQQEKVIEKLKDKVAELEKIISNPVSKN